MCGRFTLAARPEELLAEFEGFDLEEEMRPRYNIAPTQEVLVIPDDGEKRGQLLRWGLVPFWAKDTKIGAKLINARSESAAEKPAFRHAFRKGRCLIPADGFYEWKSIPGEKTKQPYHITMADGRPFAMAGLWERWTPKEGGEEVRTFTILTTRGNELVKDLHDRMPVILPKDAWDRWLDRGETPESLEDLLVPFPSEEMALRPVSKAVNNARNEGPQCLEPAEG